MGSWDFPFVFLPSKSFSQFCISSLCKSLLKGVCKKGNRVSKQVLHSRETFRAVSISRLSILKSTFTYLLGLFSVSYIVVRIFVFTIDFPEVLRYTWVCLGSKGMLDVLGLSLGFVLSFPKTLDLILYWILDLKSNRGLSTYMT